MCFVINFCSIKGEIYAIHFIICNCVLQSVQKTGRLVIAHEAPLTGGFGGEIASTIQVQYLIKNKEARSACVCVYVCVCVNVFSESVRVYFRIIETSWKIETAFIEP